MPQSGVEPLPPVLQTGASTELASKALQWQFCEPYKTIETAENRHGLNVRNVLISLHGLAILTNSRPLLN